jgi:hypothetical protein
MAISAETFSVKVFFVALLSDRCLHDESKHELARYGFLFYAGSVTSP